MEPLIELLRVLADGRFHSGKKLGESLGISRAAVWKRVQRLESLAIDAHAVPGKGYRLPDPLELLDADAIRAALDAGTLRLLQGLEVHEQLGSTNSYLMQRARAGASGGLACLAEWQQAGRGRRGRAWLSPFGRNIYLSLLWRTTSDPASLSGLSIAVGIAVVRALEDLGVFGGRLKWPNDILWQDRKLGGILIEVAGETAGPCFVVVGVGVNLHMPHSLGTAINQPWTDLRSATGSRSISRNQLAGRVIHHLLHVLQGYQHNGLLPYLEDWRRLDAFAGRPATVRTTRGGVSGVVQGVDRSGALILLVDGRIRRFTSGEVSLRAQDTAEGDQRRSHCEL